MNARTPERLNGAPSDIRRDADRMLILTEGELGVFSSKTAVGVLRYRPEAVAAVLDSRCAGRSTRDLLGVGDVPVVGTLAEGRSFGAKTLMIGIAPQGGQLPSGWRAIIAEALGAGMGVLSGLHVFLGDDPEFAKLALAHGAEIRDLRRPPDRQPVGHGWAVRTRARRLLTVGTDCNVGKMAAALELAAAARRLGSDSRFVATGQTGMMIAGDGIPLDRLPGDFMAGFVEEAVLAAGDSDLVVVEGQGCLLHPAFSGVTLSLLHGALPDTMVLVHHAGRTVMRSQELKIPPLPRWIELYESLLAPLHPGKVVGIAINPTGLTPDEARRAIAAAEDETGLPAADVVAEGAERLLQSACPEGARSRQ
jgi:uncharacterized NAD-dependent epimerase/dehydratase family protein